MEFYKTALSDNKYDYIKVFNICNNLLGRNQDLPLQPSNSNKTLADEFNNFFIQKIEKIRQDLEALKIRGLTLTSVREEKTISNSSKATNEQLNTSQHRRC